VLAAAQEAVEAGDIDGYLALLIEDAVFMPQNVAAKNGDDLWRRRRAFLGRVTIWYLQFARGEM